VLLSRMIGRRVATGDTGSWRSLTRDLRRAARGGRTCCRGGVGYTVVLPPGVPHAPGLLLAGNRHGLARVPGGGPAERVTWHRCGVHGSDACAAARRLAELGMRAWREPEGLPA
jgi:hypothetical protein